MTATCPDVRYQGKTAYAPAPGLLCDTSNAQTLAFTAASAQTAAAVPYNLVYLSTNQNVWVTESATAVAGGTGCFLLTPSMGMLLYQINNSAGSKLAAIRDSASGSLSILPVRQA